MAIEVEQITSDRVVVHVLNLNKKEEILACLRTVYNLDFSSVEVIVVDNGSTDGSVDAIRKTFSKVHLIQNPKNLGVATGRNQGFRYANENFKYHSILFLDNDTVLERQYLSRLLEALKKDERAGIACGKSYTEYPSDTVMSAGITANFYTGSFFDIGSGEKDEGQWDQTRYVDGCGGFGFLARREVITKLDGFDENFNPYGWEDLDLCLRAARRGYKTLYEPKAVLYHKGTKLGRRPLPIYEQSKAKNYLLLLKRHSSRWQRVCSFFYLPVKAFRVVFQTLSKRDFKIILSHLRGFWEGIAQRRNFNGSSVESS